VFRATFRGYSFGTSFFPAAALGYLLKPSPPVSQPEGRCCPILFGPGFWLNEAKMQPKTPKHLKAWFNEALETEIFLETSVADLVIRWPKEIRASCRRAHREELTVTEVLTSRAWIVD
jgi:hypothetical protein